MDTPTPHRTDLAEQTDSPAGVKQEDVEYAQSLNSSATSSDDASETPIHMSPTDVIAEPASKPQPVTPPRTSPSLASHTEIMAWIYPGPPACSATLEIADGRKIHVAKMEYFRIDETGKLTLITAHDDGCNGYSKENIAHIQKYTDKQYVTVSANYAHAMGVFLQNDIEKSVSTLTAFVTTNNLTGVELDFEDFGGWTDEHYTSYKKFVFALGNALHAENKKLMIDGPAVSSAIEEAWYPWRYADFNTLPVDQVVIMAYDYQFDHGAGNPVSPLQWIEDVVTWVSNEYTAKERLVVGLPSYGYRGVEKTQKINLLTYSQIKNEPGFDTAARDESSGEMTWKNQMTRYYYQDSLSLSMKRAVVEKLGIRSVSVWHLGGNLWFK